MGPEWYYEAYEGAKEAYESEEAEDDSWEELSEEKQQELIEDYIVGSY